MWGFSQYTNNTISKKKFLLHTSLFSQVDSELKMNIVPREKMQVFLGKKIGTSQSVFISITLQAASLILKKKKC